MKISAPEAKKMRLKYFLPTQDIYEEQEFFNNAKNIIYMCM